MGAQVEGPSKARIVWHIRLWRWKGIYHYVLVFWKPLQSVYSSIEQDNNCLPFGKLLFLVYLGYFFFLKPDNHQAISKDYSKLYRTDVPRNRNVPWAPHRQLPGFDATVSKTIYGQRMLSITLDEAHEFRNNLKHAAALALVELAVVKLIATATPLQTSNQVSRALLICQYKNAHWTIGQCCHGKTLRNLTFPEWDRLCGRESGCGENAQGKKRDRGHPSRGL